MPTPLAEGFLVTGYNFPPSNPLEKFYKDYDKLFGTLMPDTFPFTFTNLTPSPADAYNLVLDAIQKVAFVAPTGDLLIPRKALRDELFSTTNVQGLTGILNCDQPPVGPGSSDPINFDGDCNPEIGVLITEVQCSSESSCAFVPVQ
jgi:hypothetical protein